MITAGRIAAGGRLVVVATCTALLLVQAPPAPALGAVAGISLWQTVGWLAAGSHAVHPYRALAGWIVDVVVLAGACLVLPPAHLPQGALGLDDWVRQATSICVVTWQWSTRAVPGMLATLTTAAAVAAGSALVSDGSWDLDSAHALWLLQQGLVSRALVVLVSRGARHVDELTGALAATERVAQLAAARRADVQEHLAILHDTVAATLTAAAAHGVAGEPLALRARADLRALTAAPMPHQPSRPSAAGVRPDLLAPPATQGSPDYPRVTIVLPDDETGRRALGSELAALPPHAASALAAARDEALRNVTRHAGTDHARVELRPVPTGGVELTVVDEGRGMGPDAFAGRGLGLALSVRARMARAGGDSRVISAPGRGTRVQLRWPAPGVGETGR